MFRHIQIAVDPDARGGKAEIEAEVRLAFAAPDLLLALRKMLDSWQVVDAMTDELYAEARSAIIAATGEEP